MATQAEIHLVVIAHPEDTNDEIAAKIRRCMEDEWNWDVCSLEIRNLNKPADEPHAPWTHHHR